MTASGEFTATGTWTPTEGTGESLTVTKSGSDISVSVTQAMRYAGGTISIVVTDGTNTVTKTYAITKVYYIALGEITPDGTDYVATVTTNDSDYNIAATFNLEDITENVVKEDSGISIPASILDGTGTLTITVICDSDSDVSDTESIEIS